MAHVTLSKGGEADVLGLDGERIRLHATKPYAPGSPLVGALTDGSTLRVKVIRSRATEGGFHVEGRLIDATRAQRVALARLVTPAEPTEPI